MKTYMEPATGMLCITNAPSPTMIEVNPGECPGAHYKPVYTGSAGAYTDCTGWALDAAAAQAAMVTDLEGAVQAHMDTTAAASGYDSVFTAISYKGSANSAWAHDGDRFFNWRDAVWAYCYAQEAAVLGAQRTAPTAAELIAELNTHCPLAA